MLNFDYKLFFIIKDDNETESAFIIKRPILIRGDADFLKNFPCNYANEMSENGVSESAESELIRKVNPFNIQMKRFD